MANQNLHEAIHKDTGRRDRALRGYVSDEPSTQDRRDPLMLSKVQGRPRRSVPDYERPQAGNEVIQSSAADPSSAPMLWVADRSFFIDEATQRELRQPHPERWMRMGMTRPALVIRAELGAVEQEIAEVEAQNETVNDRLYSIEAELESYRKMDRSPTPSRQHEILLEVRVCHQEWERLTDKRLGLYKRRRELTAELEQSKLGPHPLTLNGHLQERAT